MLRKSTMLALAAVAVLGLAVSSASAGPGKPKPGINGPGMGNPGINIKPSMPIEIILSTRSSPQARRELAAVSQAQYPKPMHCADQADLPADLQPVPVVVSRPVYVAARPVASTPGPCTCLSKEYTQEGAVVFKDRCTAEMAMNPPVVTR